MSTDGDREAILCALLRPYVGNASPAEYISAIVEALLAELHARPYASRRRELTQRISELAIQHPIVVADALERQAREIAAVSDEPAQYHL